MHHAAFFDLDNTLFDGHTTSSFWEYLGHNRLVNPDSVEEMWSLHYAYKNKKISYKDVSIQMQKGFANALKGHPVDTIENHGINFLNSKNNFFPYAKEIMIFLRDRGFKTYIISAAADPIVNVVGKILSVTHTFFSVYDKSKGKYIGTVSHIPHYSEKKLIVEKFISNINSSFLTVGFGDSSNDVDMLIPLKKVFIVNPHEDIMKNHIEKNNWILTQDIKLMKKEINRALKNLGEKKIKNVSPSK